jgi:hypothetical protein
MAHRLLTSGEESAALLRATIAAARLYAEDVLAEVATCRDEIAVGATSTLALEQGLF